MIEQVPSPDTRPKEIWLNSRGVETEKEEAVFSKLMNSEVQAGIEAADEVIDEYYRELEADERSVTRLIEGVTADGWYVSVAETDDPRPSPADFDASKEEKLEASAQRKRWQRGRYHIFAYSLDEAAEPGFEDNIAPAVINEVISTRGSGIEIYTDEGSNAEDNHLHLRQRRGDAPRYKGREIRPLAYYRGKVEAAPLEAKRLEVKEQIPEAVYLEEAKQRKETKQATHEDLAERARQTILDVHRNSERALEPDLVFDKAKAEHMAYAEETARQNQAPEQSQQEAAEAAAKEYQENPVEVFEEQEEQEEQKETKNQEQGLSRRVTNAILGRFSD